MIQPRPHHEKGTKTLALLLLFQAQASLGRHLGFTTPLSSPQPKEALTAVKRCHQRYHSRMSQRPDGRHHRQTPGLAALLKVCLQDRTIPLSAHAPAFSPREVRQLSSSNYSLDLQHGVSEAAQVISEHKRLWTSVDL